MREKINKNLYRAILIISFLAANAFILFGISTVWGFLNTGADRSTMLHTEIKSTQKYLPEITWDTSNYEGRPMEKQSLKEIERDYLNSWYVKNLALETNKKYGVDDYYTDSARVNIYNTIAYNEERNLFFRNTTTSHEPELLFYSADGQLVVFNDHHVAAYSESYENEELIDRSVDTASYRVLMLLEDGFWRIRHIQQKQNETRKDTSEVKRDWSVNGKELYFKNELYDLRGINYYPQASPWDMFGDHFSRDTLRKDFKIIQNSGLNTIRIFLQYEDFGKADVQDEKLLKLKAILDEAEENGLKAVVTLFDFYGDYSVMDWTLTHEHARQIVSKFKDHPAILAWDVKNEPDLDFESRGEGEVLYWLKSVIAQIRKADPNHLITIGWSSPEAAENLKEEVDFVSFHFYKAEEELEADFANLNKKINKPLVLQEFGMSSYNGLWNPFGYDEQEQAAYHRRMQQFFQKNKLPFMSWTLYDFEEVPSEVVGILPWRKARQRHFGFLDSQGNEKPAFKYISVQKK